MGLTENVVFLSFIAGPVHIIYDVEKSIYTVDRLVCVRPCILEQVDIGHLELFEIVPVIIIGFVTMVMVRQTMRDPTIIEEYDWDEDSVFKSTGLFRVLVAMFLPVLVIMLFLLVFMYISLSAASSNYRHCPKCGGLLDAENYCYRCNIKYY